jgi:DNA repair protein RadC
MLKMKDTPICERPYEKLERQGAGYLTNSELLAIILKTGTKNETVVSIAQKVLILIKEHYDNSLSHMEHIPIQEFMKIKGIGKVKAIQLQAVCELAKRIGQPVDSKKTTINNTEDVAKLLMNELRNEKREIIKLIMLNNKDVVQKISTVSIGNGNSAKLEPKYVILEAIKMQSEKIILVHNHPSGDVTPSRDDYRITDRLYECADLMGIELLDHVIIGNNTYKSVMVKE